MNDALDKYLNLLFDGLEGFVYVPVKTPTNWKQKFFAWPNQSNELRDWIQVSDREVAAHVYISPAIYSEPSARKEAIKAIQTSWIEFDGHENIAFGNLPDPSAIVQSSSSTHLHVYWKIPVSPAKVVEDVNRRLTYYLGADTSGWDCTQLLRPPGTTNRKHDLPVLLTEYRNDSYDLRRFDVAPIIESPILEVLEPSALPTARDVMSGRNIPTRIIQMVKIEEPPVGSRSSFLVKLAYELAEEGLNHIEIVSLLYHADLRVRKFDGRSDQLLRLTQIAELAIHKIVVADSIAVYTLEDILEAPPLEWIINPWLPKKGLMILSSAPNVGKTQLGLQLTYLLSMGESFLGLTENDSEKYSILFISLEMDASGLGYIVRHQKAEHSSSPSNYHIITEEGTLTQYENLLDQYEPKVVLIDSLTELMDLTEADTDIARSKAVLKWLKKIRRRYECAVVLIHHNRKATEGNKKPKGLADLEGSFNLGRACDSAIQMWDEGTKGIELSGVKIRYGQKAAFNVKRNSNLWYERTDAVGSKPELPTQVQRKEAALDVGDGFESVQQDTSRTPDLRFGLD